MGSYQSKYDEVVDAYIPYRRSKACKQFGFVRFIKRAFKEAQFSSNFDGVKMGNSRDTYNSNGVKGAANSYAHVVKGSQNSKMDSDSSPVMIQLASFNFNTDGRVTWVEIEGIPLKMWYKNTFNHVASKWGVLLDVDDQEDEHFHRKRICINTNVPTNIFESFKLIYKGKVFWVRAKEVPGWILDFMEDNDKEEDSKVGSYEELPNGEDVKNVKDLKGDIDGEIVPDTKFEEDFPNQKGEEDSVGQGHFKKSEVSKLGGFILQLIVNLVKVGETMSASVGNSGGIMCVWDPNMFKKTNSTVSDYFVMVRGDWMPNGKKLLIISVYAPQELSEKKMLWDYLSLVMSKWKGKVVIMGDFNEVRNKSKRFGTLFNRHDANVFNRFISNAGLEDVPLEGCSFTWSHRSATKMSKLDRFLILDSLLCSCPNISSITLERYLSDHRPVLMRETLGRMLLLSNTLVKMMKKLKYLKEKIRMWNKLNKEKSHKSKRSLLAELEDCDAIIDKGVGENNVVNRRTKVVNLLQEVEKNNSLEAAQKAKIKWVIEGDENSKYYHGVINKKMNQLSIRGILVEGTWIDSPSLVKCEFLSHFKNQFEQPNSIRLHMNMHFSNTLSYVQVADLECQVSKEKIKGGVGLWD
nr:RNA-directed DNA polymerase, eukaryota [Tanacetum cinerariifolium]